MSDLLNRLERIISSHRLLSRSQPVLIAVSGGLDSMVLLRLLQQLSKKHGWQLAVAHFNHRLRGRSSDADESLVRREAQKLKLPFFVGRSDVRKAARRHKLSVEMAARRLRHEFLSRTARTLKIQTVALAHHADDQLELFFLRLFRGSGGEGLAGMKWRNPSPHDQTIELVRPLLDVPKSMLAAYAAAHRIRFREDASNALLDIPRNRIRHKLLPLLRTQFQPALDRTLPRVMEIIGAEAEFVSQIAAEWIRQMGAAKGARKQRRRHSPQGIAFWTFTDLPMPVQRRCIQLQLRELGLTMDFELVEQLRTRANLPITAHAEGAPAAHCVFRDDNGRVLLRDAKAAEFKQSEQAIDLATGSGNVVFDGVRITWRLSSDKGAGFKETPCQELFDAQKIGLSIALRHWRPGDRFQPIGMPQPIKLQDLFTNAKVPRSRRHLLMVAVTHKGEIFWVEGLRISERFKLTKNTIRRLQWHWTRF